MRVSPASELGKPRRRRHRSGHRWRLWVHAVRYVRACIFLVNIRTLTLVGLAVMMVYLCQAGILDWRFRIEFSIISVGTVFPLVFSIQQAYSRREEALRNLSTLKGLLMGMYFCNRDWDLSDGVTVRSNLGNDQAPHAVRCAEIINELLVTLKHWLGRRTTYESEAEWRMLYGTTNLRRELTLQLLGDFFRGEEERSDVSSDDDDDDSMRRKRNAETAAEKDPHWQLYYKLYDSVSQMSILNEQLMVLGGCAKAGEAGFSRLAAYVSKIVETLERLRIHREYRTPFMLRSVSLLLMIITIVMGAPYFAYMCVGSKWEDDTSGSCPAGYVTAILYVLVVSTLFHVQLALENPFDGIGMDDVFFNMDREFELTIHRYIRNKTAAEAADAFLEVQAAAKGEGKSVRGDGKSPKRDSTADASVKAFALLAGDKAGGTAGPTVESVEVNASTQPPPAPPIFKSGTSGLPGLRNPSLKASPPIAVGPPYKAAGSGRPSSAAGSYKASGSAHFRPGGPAAFNPSSSARPGSGEPSLAWGAAGPAAMGAE